MRVEGYSSWQDLAREAKEEWTLKEGPNMPPTVVAERGGRVAAMVIARRVDRDEGLWIARLLRSACDPDRLAFIVDTFSASTPRGTEGPVPGELQRRFAAGDPAVTETLGCLVATRDALAWHPLPFRRDGRRIRWLEPPAGDPATTGGYLTDELRRIMALPALVDTPEGAAIAAASGVDLAADRERAVWHTTRCGLALLAHEGCRCFDLVTGRRPDWIPAGDRLRADLHSAGVAVIDPGGEGLDIRPPRRGGEGP